ncbi:Cysteine desulfurase [Posidoniimonas polymericola]|uniref:Cysteine desulfurase n=1 Tax=Posidoniimonas polymericola TaxID=2528002 RepID=A0A5C5ZDI6_9BACT|nr:cysteine desulfurase family protein [Posidoniimonas polymericola]TWT85206.1 Cysteine desulfurase [Posidoniimonas polymericola]
MQPIYLDHNATTAPLPAVTQAVADALAAGYANASSQHEPGRRARRVVEQARGAIAAALGARTAGITPDELLLTSGGTESNNHALQALLGPKPAGERLVISAIEHPSITGFAELLERRGVAVDRLPVDASGVVRLDALPELLAKRPRLVSVMLGNNETGVLQPVAELAALCRPHGVPVHTDATQVVGKQPVDFQRLGVSLLTFTAHKFHGPRGIGGLLVEGGLQAEPLLYGQPGAQRPGTASVELAVGMQRAIELWQAEAAEREARMRALRDRLEQAITADDPNAIVVGADAKRLPHTSCVAFQGLDRQALQMALDHAGVACSTGSACASGSSEPSPTLLAIGAAGGLSEAAIRGSVRFSLGAATTAAQIDDAAERILSICKRLRRRE